MLSSRTVGSIVGLQSDAISEIAMEYAKRQAALQQETSELKAGKTGGTQNHKRQVAVMEKAIEEEKTKLEEVYAVYFVVKQIFIDFSVFLNVTLMLLFLFYGQEIDFLCFPSIERDCDVKF